MAEVTYAHKDDPKGQRFLDIKIGSEGSRGCYPDWAVDVKDVDPCLNARGLPYHATDTYIHWTERDPVTKMKELREAYDALTKGDKSLIEHLETLLQAAYNSGGDDERDNESGF